MIYIYSGIVQSVSGSIILLDRVQEVHYEVEISMYES